MSELLAFYPPARLYRLDFKFICWGIFQCSEGATALCHFRRSNVQGAECILECLHRDFLSKLAHQKKLGLECKGKLSVIGKCFCRCNLTVYGHCNVRLGAALGGWFIRVRL